MAKRIYYYTQGQSGGQTHSASAVISVTGTVLSTASVLISSSASIEATSFVTATIQDSVLDRARLSEILRAWIENPTGCWNDYNTAWKTWYTLRAYGADYHIVSEEEALSLNEPRTIDYSDLECQGYSRVRLAKRIKASIEVECSVLGRINVEGWVGSGNLSIECNTVVSSFATNFLRASASISATSGCQARRVPDEQTMDYFTHILAEPVRNKSNNWSDYNTQYKRYQNLLKLVNMGLMKEEDLPEEPKVEDYAELI